MTEQAKILLLDDETNIRATLSEVLNGRYQVTAVADGASGLQQLSQNQFDLVLLDIRLPDINGIDILKTIRQQHPCTEVVMITGSATIDNAIESLRHGAIDYLRKPFSTPRLLECIQHALNEVAKNRQQQEAIKQLVGGLHHLTKVTPLNLELPQPEEEEQEPDRLLKQGPLIIDTHQRTARLNNKPLDLTPGEYDLLYILARESPRVVCPTELVEETRGFSCSLMEARSLIRWQIYLLRQKLEEDSSSPNYILNVRGRGYMWAAA